MKEVKREEKVFNRKTFFKYVLTADGSQKHIVSPERTGIMKP